VVAAGEKISVMVPPPLALTAETCRFCGRSSQSWAAEGTPSICAQCLEICREVLREPRQSSGPRSAKPREKAVFCSFCGQSQFEVGRLIAGAGVTICSDCVAAIPA